MTEQFRPLLDPNRRPLFPSEKKIWKIKHEPRRIETLPLFPESRIQTVEPRRRPEQEEKMTLLGFLGFLFLTFLDAIIDLPEHKELSIEGEGK